VTFICNKCNFVFVRVKTTKMVVKIRRCVFVLCEIVIYINTAYKQSLMRRVKYIVRLYGPLEVENSYLVYLLSENRQFRSLML